MAPKYSPADYLFQFITVTAGVFIALVIDGLTDWNNNRELVAQARSTIAREIRDNKKAAKYPDPVDGGNGHHVVGL